jgi:hypothetical protein
MDSDIMQGVTAVLGLMVPILGISVIGLVLIARSRLGDALACRISGERSLPEYDDHLNALQEELAHLRGQLRETQERLDFAERLLVQPRAGLPAAGAGG